MARKARIPFTALCALAGAALLGACAAPPGPGAQDVPSVRAAPPHTAGPGSIEPAAGAGVLDGGIWTLVKLNGAAIPPDHAPTLAFQGRSVTGSTGCNRYFGEVSVTETGVVFGPMGVSRRACAPEIMDLENDFLAALRRSTVLRFVTATD